MPASVLNIALPGFARRISAQSSHTIRQTSLLGRRPAVRRKPLNNFSFMSCAADSLPAARDAWRLRLTQIPFSCTSHAPAASSPTLETGALLAISLHCSAEYQCFGLDILKPIKKGDASLLKATAVSPSQYMPSYTEKRFGNRIGNRNNCSSVSRSSIARREPIHLCGATQILATTILILPQETFPRFSPVNSILRSLRRGEPSS